MRRRDDDRLQHRGADHECQQHDRHRSCRQAPERRRGPGGHRPRRRQPRLGQADARPGALNGRLFVRTHTADVEIPYTPAAYCITYKSSIHLNESGGQIHRNYNGWIQNLTRNINA